MGKLIELSEDNVKEFEHLLCAYNRDDTAVIDVEVCIVIEYSNDSVKFYNVYKDKSIGIGCLSNSLERYLIQTSLERNNIPIIFESEIRKKYNPNKTSTNEKISAIEF